VIGGDARGYAGNLVICRQLGVGEGDLQESISNRVCCAVRWFV
jgi:hypothetical protein